MFCGAIVVETLLMAHQGCGGCRQRDDELAKWKCMECNRTGEITVHSHHWQRYCAMCLV